MRNPFTAVAPAVCAALIRHCNTDANSSPQPSTQVNTLQCTPTTVTLTPVCDMMTAIPTRQSQSRLTNSNGPAPSNPQTQRSSGRSSTRLSSQSSAPRPSSTAASSTGRSRTRTRTAQPAPTTTSGTTRLSTTSTGQMSPSAASTSLTTAQTAQATPSGTARSWWAPKPGDTWLWDLSSSSVPAPALSRPPSVMGYNADVYVVDPNAMGKQGIEALHANGKKVVCYVDVGSWEPWRADADSFDADCICGDGISLQSDGTCPTDSHKMSGWDEWWFNLHDTKCAQSVGAGMYKRFENARALGCDAIEPDNIDAWQNEDATGAPSAGWGITIADQTVYLTRLANDAHSLGMGILLKNAGGLLVGGDGSATQYASAITQLFDGSINEQCHQYSECDIYAGFGAAGKVMWNAEYINTSGTSDCDSTEYNNRYCDSNTMKTLQYSCLDVTYENLVYVCP